VNCLAWTTAKSLTVPSDESTLYRCRQGGSWTAVYLNRLDRLDDLAREIQRTIPPRDIPDWLTLPIPASGDATATECPLNEQIRYAGCSSR
jgi:hypothetical protein